MSSSVSARRAWPIAAFAIAVALLAALLNPIAASAAPVALSGKVLARSGAPLAGVTVDLVVQSAANPAIVASATSNATGAFSMPPVTAGYYTLRFGASATTFAQYLGGTNDFAISQTVALVNGGGNTNYISATLSPSGALAGKVATLAGAAIPKYTVRAYRASDDSTWALAATTQTSTKGLYSFPSVEPGSYRIEVLDTANSVATYAPAYSGNAVSLDSAVASIVTAQKTTTVNFALGAAGRVSGTVTGASDSATEKLAGVTVTPYRLDGVAGNYSGATAIPDRTVVTSATGAYTVSGLVPGDYVLEFRARTTAPLPASGVVYGREFLGGPTALTATIAHIDNGSKLTGRNILLKAGATVSGTVRDAASPATALSDVRVMIDHDGAAPDSPGNDVAWVTTDSLGHYSFTGLGAGDYTLFIGSHSDTPGDSVAENTGWIRQTLTVSDLTSLESRVADVELTAKDPLGLHATTTPAITPNGAWKVGTTVSATRGIWNVETSTTFNFQWLRSGSPIPGATEPEYTLDSGDQYYTISIRVRATNFAYGAATSKSTESPLIAVGNAPT